MKAIYASLIASVDCRVDSYACNPETMVLNGLSIST